MKRLIAIPVFHLSCKVGIDKGRAWSVVDELLLWRVDRAPETIAGLVTASGLPRSLVVASLARMMRFRMVEVSVAGGTAAFKSSPFGKGLVGEELPYFPKRISRRVSFVVERATGELLRRRDVRLLSLAALERERRTGIDVRLVHVEGGEPPMSPEANLGRLAALAVRGHDERLANVDATTASRRDNELLVVDVVDGVVSGLPGEVGDRLRSLASRLAREKAAGDITIRYAGPTPIAATGPTRIPCDIVRDDVVVGGAAHKAAFLSLLEQAQRRVVVHSTFLAVEKFEALREAFRAACRRGVLFDILWGAESDDDTVSKNGLSAAKINELIRDDLDLAGRVRVHLRSTGSHAKVVLCDGASSQWTAVVGSCNWLLSPFRSVELSAVLRAPHAVADVVNAVARLVGRRGNAFDELGSELSLLASNLRDLPAVSGASGAATLVAGETHERIVRSASGSAKQRLVIGSHRLGATARSGALLQGATAAARSGAKATLIYSTASGPLSPADADALRREMDSEGVTVSRARSPKLHAKFLLWDDNDIVVTSFNWASASVDSTFPEAEIGVHLHAPGLAADVLRRLQDLVPELVDGS